MTDVTKVNGDSDGVPGHDIPYKRTAYVAGTPVQTGIGKKVTAYKINPGGAIDLTTVEFGVGGAVDAILRCVAQQGTILAYQGETGADGQLSVFVEGSGWETDTILRDAIRAITAGALTVGLGPITLDAATCTSAGGLKLA